MKVGVISPQDWGWPVSARPGDERPADSQKAFGLSAGDGPIPGLDLPAGEIERRIRLNIYEWLPRQFDPGRGAYYGFYRASDGYREPPQTVNLLASWQLMAAFDRFGDEQLLNLARGALDDYFRHFVVSHPMSIACGGARDGVAVQEVWTKFTAEFVIGALGLYDRAGEKAWLERAEQSGRYLVQAARHGYAPGYRLDQGRWMDADAGWDSWGRVVEACLALEQATGEGGWRELALRWGEHALEVQSSDGCFYLINGEYYNTDLAADELRGLIFLYELSDDERFIQAARRFADWHLATQRPDGAWGMTRDREGNLVVPTVGPGDVPNIAIALLRLHLLMGSSADWDAALRAFRYSLSMQVIPGGGQPYAGDPQVQWGFWSWDPYYDYTLSADQATHHIRGMMFLLDYLGRLSSPPTA
jgi:hypothetical protein